MARQFLWDLRDFLRKPKAKPKQRKMQPAGTLITASPRQHRGMNSWAVLALELLPHAATLLVGVYLIKFSAQHLDPDFTKKKQAGQYTSALSRNLGQTIPQLDVYEAGLCSQALVTPGSMDTVLADIGGLDETKQAVVDKVMTPLLYPGKFQGPLLRQAKGLLLYGPPGTGKTMLAKALAKQSGARFLNILPSQLQSKWYGDTNKTIRALFSLAQKLQPCIIFIDEVDAVLGHRKGFEHEVTTSLKTELLQLWDGLATREDANVLLMGATNRRGDLDAAVMRRFVAQYEVGLPNKQAREDILKVILARHGRGMGEECVSAELLQNIAGPSGKRPLERLAEATEFFSGSDLFNLCSAAATNATNKLLREHLQRQQVREDLSMDSDGDEFHALEADQESEAVLGLKDLLEATRDIHPVAAEASQPVFQYSQQPSPAPFDLTEAIAASMAAKMMASGAPNGSNNNGSRRKGSAGSSKLDGVD